MCSRLSRCHRLLPMTFTGNIIHHGTFRNQRQQFILYLPEPLNAFVVLHFFPPARIPDVTSRRDFYDLSPKLLNTSMDVERCCHLIISGRKLESKMSVARAYTVTFDRCFENGRANYSVLDSFSVTYFAFFFPSRPPKAPVAAVAPFVAPVFPTVFPSAPSARP